MIRLPFWKVQSIGNDFPLFHLDDLLGAIQLIDRELSDPLLVSASAPPQATDGCSVDLIDRPAVGEHPNLDRMLSELAIEACDRHFGIGGDGLLTVAMEDGHLRLRMFNPDGTEDFCGNGLRCAAIHAYRQGWVERRFAIRHLGKRVDTEILGEGRARMVIGRADYTPGQVPVDSPVDVFDQEVWRGDVGGEERSYQGSSLTTGSTHTVIWGPPPGDEEFVAASRQIEVAPRFPDRTSVLWAEAVEPDRIRVRVWERGVGETLGCGTGSSAVAADYLRRAGRGGSVKVVNPGGWVTVSMDRWDAPITIEGVAEEVYTGEFVFRAPSTPAAAPSAR